MYIDIHIIIIVIIVIILIIIIIIIIIQYIFLWGFAKNSPWLILNRKKIIRPPAGQPVHRVVSRQVAADARPHRRPHELGEAFRIAVIKDD